MPGISDRNNTDSFDNTQVVIKGDDNLYTAAVTLDKRLKVESQAVISRMGLPCLNKKYRMKDMNATTNGIARGSSVTVAAGYTRVFGYTGNGYFLGFLLNLETSTGWTIKLEIDSEIIFEISYDDMGSASVYNTDINTDPELGISLSTGDIFQYHPCGMYPIYFGTKCELFVKRAGSTKKFDAGLMFYTEGY